MTGYPPTDVRAYRRTTPNTEVVCKRAIAEQGVASTRRFASWTRSVPMSPEETGLVDVWAGDPSRELQVATRCRRGFDCSSRRESCSADRRVDGRGLSVRRWEESVFRMGVTKSPPVIVLFFRHGHVSNRVKRPANISPPTGPGSVRGDPFHLRASLSDNPYPLTGTNDVAQQRQKLLI